MAAAVIKCLTLIKDRTTDVVGGQAVLLLCLLACVCPVFTTNSWSTSLWSKETQMLKFIGIKVLQMICLENCYDHKYTEVTFYQF